MSRFFGKAIPMESEIPTKFPICWKCSTFFYYNIQSVFNVGLKPVCQLMKTKQTTMKCQLKITFLN